VLPVCWLVACLLLFSCLTRYFCRAVKRAYDRIRAQLPKGVRNSNVLSVASRALLEGLSKEAIVSGFESCGIWPLDPERLLKSAGLQIESLVKEVEQETKAVIAGDKQAMPPADLATAAGSHWLSIGSAHSCLAQLRRTGKLASAMTALAEFQMRQALPLPVDAAAAAPAAAAANVQAVIDGLAPVVRKAPVAQSTTRIGLTALLSAASYERMFAEKRAKAQAEEERKAEVKRAREVKKQENARRREEKAAGVAERKRSREQKKAAAAAAGKGKKRKAPASSADSDDGPGPAKRAKTVAAAAAAADAVDGAAEGAGDSAAGSEEAKEKPARSAKSKASARIAVAAASDDEDDDACMESSDEAESSSASSSDGDDGVGSGDGDGDDDDDGDDDVDEGKEIAIDSKLALVKGASLAGVTQTDTASSRFAGDFVVLNMEGQSRPYSIGKVTDAKSRSKVTVRYMTPDDENDPLGSRWTLSRLKQDQQPRGAVFLRFTFDRGRLLPASVQAELSKVQSSADMTAASEASSSDAGCGAGSGSSSGSARASASRAVRSSSRKSKS
jgi:hypothetical protein